MEEELKQTKDFLQKLSDQLSVFIAEHSNDQWTLFFQILGKFLLLALLIYLADFIIKIIINFFFRFFVDENKFPVLKSIYKSRITNSLSHLLALLIGNFAYYSIFYQYKEKFNAYFERLVEFSLVIIIAGMAFRFLKAVENYYFIKKDYYRIVALRAISQTVKIFGILVFSVLAISAIFGIKGTTILGSLGAMTAVILLVFRDTILGFVTGIHVATSQSLKEGDWVGIPKYNLEGTIESIGLLTTKILGFDKTMSTIPTYDLLSTEIRNLQVMSETNTRRIKKSIIFNIKSFKFLDDGMMERLSKVNLLKDYLNEKKNEIAKERMTIANPEEIINGKQLTNIGTFRIYAFNYLKNNPHIDQEGTLMVRQLEITSQGLPLEIYAFANDSKWENFEQIQADIFDHLMVAAHEFDLEIMQVNKI